MVNNLYSSFTNQFTLSKSLEFELIPMGKTLENMEKAGILDIDKQRNANYQIVRKGIDEYHREYIDKALSNLTLTGLDEYYSLYKIPYKERSEDEKKRSIALEMELRKQISTQLRSGEIFHLLFGKELISDILPEYFADNEQMLAALETFDGFTTYFKNHHALREALYSSDRKASSVSFRIINENLPKFFFNMDAFDKIAKSPVANDIGEIEKWIGVLTGTDGVSAIVENMFTLEHFPSTASQKGIDNYNLIIGGYSDEEGTHYKGLNNYIHEHNQNSPVSERLPLLVPLFKQLLAVGETVSFVPDKFENDQDVLFCIKDFYAKIKDVIRKQELLVNSLEEYDLEKIYLKNDKSLTNISKKLYGDWEYIQKALNHGYDKENRKKTVRNEEKYAEKRRRYFAKIGSFSIAELNDAITEFAGEVQLPLQQFFKTGVDNEISNLMVVDNLYDELADLMNLPYPKWKNLRKDDKACTNIKAFLDALKEWQNKIKPLCGKGDESGKDDTFYGQFDALWADLFVLTGIYNKVRNYITKKITASEKVKLNFSNPTLGDGWSSGVEREKGCLLFMDVENGHNAYYLGIIDKDSRNMFKEYPQPKDENDAISKMYYYQSADPTKSIMNLLVKDGETKCVKGRKEKSGPHAGENLILEEEKNKYLPPEINRIRLNRGYSKSSEHFNQEDLQAYIAYYKQRIYEYLPDCDFGEDFFDIEFNDWNDFTAYIKTKAYSITLREISRSWLYERVEEGALYLFQIANADLKNPEKHGKKKITTRYLEMLFKPENFKNGTVYKLNGGAEVFFRPAAIKLKDTAIHVQDGPIANKNPLNESKENTFKYNIIKNRAATKDAFLFNFSIECNFSAEEKTPLNLNVRKAIRASSEPINIIGISRGENHLLYYTVIDEKGNVLEQKSLNEIETVASSGEVKRKNYNARLATRESERDKAKDDWKEIESIKDLKTGYLSQVIYIITQLMMKYNACVVIEDLSTSFKNERRKIEKAVYDKFDSALTNKLSFLIDKDLKDDEVGGLLKALQLAAPESKDNQNGFLFYVNPAYTSNIDPKTGFVNMFGNARLNYTNSKDAVLFIRKLESIKYDEENDVFTFTFDYARFGRGEGTKTDWTISTHGRRTKRERNKQSGQWEYETIDLTRAFKSFCEEHDIDINADIQEQILEKASAKLLRSFMELFKLTMQMHNKIGDEDHFISPVMCEDGTYFNTSENDMSAPICAAANSAYNIARKGSLYLDMIRKMEDEDNSKLAIKNVDWFNSVQK